jgi:arsenate reductase (glutaredoxin)
VRIAEDLGAEITIVNYIQDPPDAERLREIIAKLEDPATNLVRRDAKFKKLTLTEQDVTTDDQIVEILVKHKQLLQRPLLVTRDKAIIGRPKSRVNDLLS